MPKYRSLPRREHVFLVSLQHHGFRYTRRRKNLKKKYGYIIPATNREDSSGIDFWVKLPKEHAIIPIQVTQRGVSLFRKYERNITPEKIQEYTEISNIRLRKKKAMCQRNGVAFVLVRDYDGQAHLRSVAWGDKKALLYAIKHMNTRQ